jgi:two-component system phosphate regulon sensor histidine kinase PhoR
VAASSEAHLRLTPDGRIEEMNPAAKRLLGAPKGELAGELLSLSITIDDRSRLRDVLRAARHGEPQRRQPFRVHRADVETAVELTVLAYDGGLRCVIHADPPERDAPPPDAPRLRRVLDRLDVGALVVDDRLVVVEANVAARRILARPRLVRGAALSTPGDENDELVALTSALLGSGPAWRRRSIPAAEREVSVRASRLGGASCVLLIVEDTAPQEAAERGGERFAWDVAHELRTPISSILGATELLLGPAGEDPTARDQFVELIRREAERAAGVATSLLVLARAEAGAEAPRLELIPLAEIVDDVVGSLRAVYPGVDLETSVPRSAATFTNRELAQQLLRNLIENAIRHAGGRGISVVGGELHERVAVEIRDQGPGMLPEHVARALEPFAQPAGATGSGYGLGLAIAARATRALGGRLDLRSTPGAGTVARVELPSATLVST